MPQIYTYPGVYVEEISSGVRTITGVSTSDTAFVDFFPRGPANHATKISSYTDFQRIFGGLDSRSEASYAINQFSLNGGSIAWVVRVETEGALAASLILGPLKLQAASYGVWGNNLYVGVDYRTPQPDKLFNLAVRLIEPVNGRDVTVATETYRNLSMDRANSRYVGKVLEDQSDLVLLSEEPPATSALPTKTGEDVLSPSAEKGVLKQFGKSTDVIGNDGDAPPSFEGDPSGASWLNTAPEKLKAGMHALERIAPSIFNLLCVPAAAKLGDDNIRAVYSEAITFCTEKRAFLLVDIPASVNKLQSIQDWTILDSIRDNHAAIYFPLLSMGDPLNENRPRIVGSSGTMAGLYARTDAERGVWKAPAGTEASLRGATPTVTMTDLENGFINPLGINALRTFPIFGSLSWGARTLHGADQQASEWKYIPVRRLALYIEESLFQGLKWVVFEPNDEPLWAQIRLNVGAFMHNLFRQGAFQGKTPRDAYFVKCDKETTTQNDINLGIVNVVVGFAPLKPAEFVIIKLQQMAGQIEV